MKEAEFIDALRRLPLAKGARHLTDDAALLPDGIVLTKDLIAEGVHFLSDDTPADVAWKLVAVNLSDLAAKGATPEGVLLGYPLSDDTWDRAFLAGLDAALRAFECPLLGGDTIALPAGAPRILSLTAIGRSELAPDRSGARPGDLLYVTGTIGDAGAGLAIARGADGPAALLERYRRPHPRLAAGLALAPIAHAMMDVSDGLLVDALRMADASGCALAIDLDRLPLSSALRSWAGDDLHALLAAATAGDDYELLFAAPPGAALPVAATRLGRFSDGSGIALSHCGAAVPPPKRLGFLHGG